MINLIHLFMYSSSVLLYLWITVDPEPILLTLDMRQGYTRNGTSHEASTPQMLHSFQNVETDQTRGHRISEEAMLPTAPMITSIDDLTLLLFSSGL